MLLFTFTGESLNGNGGRTNPLCGATQNMNGVKRHTFRCELYGKYVTVKKTVIPSNKRVGILEVGVNREPAGKFYHRQSMTWAG